MTIKKLTVAAAIAVGIATCSFSSAMAACPISGCNSCPTMTTTGPCETPCVPACPAPCVTPCVPACPTACAPACPAPIAPCPQPACTTCPNTSCDELDMKQVYGYPNAIYGTNNYTGEQTNAIYSTETAWLLDRNENLAADGLGVCSGAAAPFGFGLTGAAAPMGYGNNCGCCHNPDIGNPGVIVSRSCKKSCNSCCDNGYMMGAAAPFGNGCLPVITGAAAPCGCDSGCGISIGTPNSIPALKRTFSSLGTTESQCAAPCSSCAGAAAPLVEAFPDVPSSYWAACPIDRLACNDIVVGYPDRLFRPNRDISRAEFATMMVKGYNLNCAGLCTKNIFKDVPSSHWANPLIAKAVEEGIMCGYPGNKFKPKQPVSRVEALTAMAHGINCDIDACKAKEILGQYTDGNTVPDWAQIPVAKALQSGALKTSPNCNTINPCDEASRAEIADMLNNSRIALGLDTNTPVASCDCPAAPCAPVVSDCGCKKTTYMASEEMVKIPTLKVCFRDEINAKSSNVGDQFAANTTEDITINGECYKCGSRVNGKVVEVIRPSGCNKGALKVAFTNIEGCNNCKVDLPKQVLTAQIDCTKTQNIFSRLIAAPFTLVGGLIGTTGRTIGGVIASAGNAAEAVSGGTGIAMGELLQGPCQFRAAGRSLQDAAKAAIMAPVDATRTALSGATGLLQTTGDEVAYLVDPSGSKISAINPKEKVTIAFGCH